MKDLLIFNDVKIPIKVAITEEEHYSGLMLLKKTSSMIFPYIKPEVHKFWMKNTLLPLDIIFCHKGSIISIEKGIPLSENFIGPNAPTDLVVELPTGSAGKLGMRPGDKINIKYSWETRYKLFLQTLHIFG